MAVLVFTFRTFVAEAYVIKGHSMLPTFREADRLLIAKITLVNEMECGDVIVFEHEGKRLIKRVIALGGDFVEIRDGQVFVNDEPLEEPYTLPDTSDYYRIRVPRDAVFVLGDHRKSSSDSRSWGPVPMDCVLGKALFRFYPLWDWELY